MTITPEELLAGWRGRRLLLGVALRSEAVLAERDGAEAPLAQAVWTASYELDPGRGRSVRLIRVGDSGDEPPPATPEDVADALGQVRLTDLDEGSTLRVLAEVVTLARYWQEPDGEDVLAATPVVRAALGRVAAHVCVQADVVGWWSEPIARADQHAVAWQDPAAPPPRTQGVAERLARWRDAQAAGERGAAERSDDPTASWSGEWWSTPPPDLTHTTRSLGRYGPVGVWLVEDEMGWERAVTRRAAIPGDAQVYEVDGPEAWAALCRAYPQEVTAQKRHDWYRTTGQVGRWVVPDWAAVAADHDGVHLTVAAYLAAAGTAVPVGADTASVIAGWNPDETYWFVDAVEPKGDGTAWVLDDDGWAPAAHAR